MKKTLSLILTLALIAGISAPAYAATPTGGFSITDKRGPATIEEDIATTYKLAMNRIDSKAISTFLDPHEAWDDFIATRTMNNWFSLPSGVNSSNIDVPDYYCYAPSKYGIDDVFDPVGHTELFDLCRASFPGHYNEDHHGIWDWGTGGWSTTAYYEGIMEASEFGHPNFFCNQDHPVTWNIDGKRTYADTMYTGDYSAEMQAKIQTWWDTLDAYIATQNGTAAPTPVETQAPAAATSAQKATIADRTPAPEQSKTVADSTSNPAPTVDKDDAAFTINGVEIKASDWALKDITAAINAGIYTFDNPLINGYVTEMANDAQRSKFCIFVGGLFRALGKTNMLDGAFVDDESKFKDLQWDGDPERREDMIEIVSPGYKTIMSLSNLGIINGYEDGNFHYTDSLTREQAATIIQRTATVLGINLPDGDIPFTDGISDWALDGVRHCYAAGLMNGYDDTTFGAKDNYTYEQALITVYRLYQYAVANG